MPNTTIQVYPSVKSLTNSETKSKPWLGWRSLSAKRKKFCHWKTEYGMLAHQSSNYPARASQKQLLNLVPFSSLEKYLDRFLFPCQQNDFFPPINSSRREANKDEFILAGMKQYVFENGRWSTLLRTAPWDKQPSRFINFTSHQLQLTQPHVRHSGV